MLFPGSWHPACRGGGCGASSHGPRPGLPGVCVTGHAPIRGVDSRLGRSLCRWWIGGFAKDRRRAPGREVACGAACPAVTQAPGGRDRHRRGDRSRRMGSRAHDVRSRGARADGLCGLGARRRRRMRWSRGAPAVRRRCGGAAVRAAMLAGAWSGAPRWRPPPRAGPCVGGPWRRASTVAATVGRGTAWLRSAAFANRPQRRGPETPQGGAFPEEGVALRAGRSVRPRGRVDQPRSCSADCGWAVACDRTEMLACCRMLLRVSCAVS